MEPQDYIVFRIEGEYAILKSIENDAEIFVAMALLPPGIDVGTKLHSEYMQYTVI